MSTETTLAAELAEDAAERLLRYVRIDTRSDEESDTYPSTEGQLELLRLLRDELEAVGLADVTMDEHGYVTGTLPATVEHDVPTIALFAHVDTAREVSGAGVSPQRVRYEGGEIVLGDSGQSIQPELSPELENHVGHELITTDGTTLLGADDKAGLAEIMAAAAYLVAHPEIPHGTVKVAFNPDEEIGRGVVHFPVESFGAVAAYTVDGSTVGELQTETFSGAQVRMRIHGRAIHPGWASGELVNAIKIAGQILARLPQDRLSPETTEGREGYVHPVLLEGDSSEVELRFIVRDFDDDRLAEHIAFLSGLADDVCATEPRCTVEVEHRIQYRNPRAALERYPQIVAHLEDAIRRVGLEPKQTGPFASARGRRAGSPRRGARRSGDLLERGARVAVLDAVLDLDRAARLGGADVVGEAGQEGDVLGEAIVVEVAHDEAQLDLGRVALEEHGVNVSLPPLGRLGREAVLRQAGEDLPGDLDRVHELATRPAGMDRAPVDAHADLRAGERLGLQLAGGRAVDRVGGDGAEALDREVNDAAADLLVRVEGDLDRAVRDFRIRDEIAVAAMISTIPALSSAPSSLVPSVTISSWPTWSELRRRPADHLPRVAEYDLAAFIPHPPRETPAPLTSRAVSTWANSAIVGTSCSTVPGRVPVT